MSFTAAVSHELRTPLARILALLDSASLPGAAVHDLIDQARVEVEQAGHLISEVVAFGSTAAGPVIRETLESLEDSALRAGVELRFEGDEDITVPLRPRML